MYRQNIPLRMLQTSSFQVQQPQQISATLSQCLGVEEHITQMLVVFIFGCLIPATIRVVQQFQHLLMAAVVAIFGLRLALGAYVAIMTKGLQPNSEALLE